MISEVRTCVTCARGDARITDSTCSACFAFDAWTPEVATVSADTLLADQRRLEWILPVMSLSSDPASVGHARTMALGAALMLGKTDRDAIDFAMEGSP